MYARIVFNRGGRGEADSKVDITEWKYLEIRNFSFHGISVDETTGFQCLLDDLVSVEFFENEENQKE